MSEAFDPFTIEIVKEKLHAAADEMGVVLARTSMSPIVYEVLDFACGITDAEAQVVAQTNGLTLFTGTFGPQIQSILRKHGRDGMHDGDVFATNIPYEGGTHTCDVCLVKPIVVSHPGSDPAGRGQSGGGRVIGFAVSVTHWIEIGGAVPGSISPEATEIYQEGLQLPGVRVVEQDVPNQALIDVIEANIRLPRTGIGDLNAGLAATAIGEARVRAACDRYGVELVLASFARVLDHGEQIARAELRLIPNGVYRATGVIDGDGVSDAEIPIAVAVTVGDDFLHADFTGCAPQTRGPVNCSTGALLSACKTVVRAITAPSARSNDGFFRPFSLTVPPGTVFSAEPPAPTGWYYEGAAFANDLIWKALAPVVPERLGAGSYTSLCCSYVVGTDATGELFVLAEPNVGGWGGSALGDGASALIATTDGDTYNFPVEVVESRYPVLVERYALNVEAGGGAGRRRGGFGVVRTYRVHGAREASGYGSVGGFGRVPWALGGGSPGTQNFLDYTTPVLHLRRGRVPRVELADGAVLSSVTGTGGGFGDPLEREPERVREDVLDGYVTIEQARALYGVALVPESLEPDAAETARLRAR
jgi:N-methylhydantoinase B